MNIRRGTVDLDFAYLILVIVNVVVVQIGEHTVSPVATPAREVLDPVNIVIGGEGLIVQCVAGCGDPARGLVVIDAATRIASNKTRSKKPDLVSLVICGQKRPGCGPRVELENPGVVRTSHIVGEH